MSDWATNTTLERIAVHLLGAGRIALLTHTRPDGDAVGSTIAVARALQHAGREAFPVYTGNWSPRFDQLVGHTPVVYEAPGCWDEAPLDDIGAVLVLDTGSWSQLMEAHDWLEPRHATTALIDHHAHGDPDVADLRVIETSAAAACEIVGRLCCLIVGVESATQLPIDIAEPLYVGLATDTGWFRHSNVSPAAFRLAGDLLEAGVDHERIFEIVEQNDRPARLALMQRALASLEYFDDERIAVMTLSQEDFLKAEADIGDAGGFADLPRMVGTVRAAAVIIETEQGTAKASFRSKGGEDSVDVNLVAQQLGGGGHKHAAGARLPGPLASARKSVIQALTAQEARSGAR